MRHALRIALATLCLAAPLLAQGEPVSRTPIDVALTSVSGPVLTLDRGAESGIARGDTFVLRTPAGLLLEGTVTGVSARSAQVELFDLDGDTVLAVGLRGEVLVPTDRAAPDSVAPPQGVPEHPPWEQPVGQWAPGVPLLAPVQSPTPEERPADVDGRIFTRLEYTDDSQYDNEYLRAWMGLDLEWTNPLEHGGALRIKGDLSYRDWRSGSDEEDELLSRFQRLSYRLGGRVDEGYRLEVGRFLHSEFPQFGLLDGAEYVHRFSGGSRLGASLGMLPEWDDELASTDTVGAALFYRWVSDLEESLALGLGYQKTWHGGQADRDLFAGTVDWLIGPNTTLRGSALVDLYDSTAQLKSEGLSLTELHLSLDQRFGTGAGLGLFANSLEWPELLQNPFPQVLPETLADQRTTYTGVHGWARVSEGVRLSGRLQSWRDEKRSGGSGELACDLRDVLYEGGELGLALTDAEGAFSSGIGGRLRWTHWFDASTLRVGYETMDFDQEGFAGVQAQLLQHVVRGSFDTRLAADLDLSLHAEQRFGDEQDSLTAGFRLQWRF